MSNANDALLSTRRRVAEAAAREAGKLALDRFRNRRFTVEAKGTQDFVSEVDKETEKLIRARLGAVFPEDGFIGEETGGTPERIVWVVDPIDGTHNFVRGIGFWCVSIGLAVDGKPSVGVIYDPIQDELYSAAAGQGATLNGEPIRVSATTEPTEAVVAIGANFRKPAELHVNTIATLFEERCSHRGQGAGALSLALVSAGRLDGYFENHINSWDVMAGIVLIAEAGGFVNDFMADNGLMEGNTIFACAPGLKGFLSKATGFVC